ncbi:MAG TPA: glycoside hydrolase [Nitrospirae bacterium]|nr:glycoside hydrolase [Nitrospirota bacterium]
MHQPSYRDPMTGHFCLPWVRLHGTKDYLDMMLILKDYPKIHQTFNIVPSLFEQLICYIQKGDKDKHLEVTLKEPSGLTEEERIFIVENFFLANWDTMVKPYPRYFELLLKRGYRYGKADLKRIHRYFNESDIRDLQVWFNLVWIDPMFVKDDRDLQDLYKKGADFTEEEKMLVINKQFNILKRIIPTYKEFYKNGQVELSVTPFYHPILPLLWDTNNARIAMPYVKLPKRRFSYPQDAINQIKMGIDFFENLFGKKPLGMWPSEGSVCEDVVKAIAREGINWIATDEDVLAASLGYGFRDSDGNVNNPSALYKPYNFEGVNIFFRDHKLSDQIGFVYSGWDARDAVNDFMGRLANIYNIVPRDQKCIVPVILDGENAWEYYRNDGQDFLRLLYETLSNDNRFKTVTISEFLSQQVNTTKLDKLHAGSWIYANFAIWIGHDEDNLSWEYLSQTRQDLETFVLKNPDKDVSEAWKYLYSAEGSDWNWWYGDEHSTETAEVFDELYRKHLMKVYEIIGLEIPAYLYVPILIEDREVLPKTEIRGFIYPSIDGMVTSYYEWLSAGYLDHKQSGGSMHRSEGFITGIYYGFNEKSFFIRLDPINPFSTIKDHIKIDVKIIKPPEYKLTVEIENNSVKTSLTFLKDEKFIPVKTTFLASAKDIFELQIPFDQIGVNMNDEIQFSIHIMKNGDEIERCPWRGYITFTCPSPDYEKMMWY